MTDEDVELRPEDVGEIVTPPPVQAKMRRKHVKSWQRWTSRTTSQNVILAIMLLAALGFLGGAWYVYLVAWMTDMMIITVILGSPFIAALLGFSALISWAFIDIFESRSAKWLLWAALGSLAVMVALVLGIIALGIFLIFGTGVL